MKLVKVLYTCLNQKRNFLIIFSNAERRRKQVTVSNSLAPTLTSSLSIPTVKSTLRLSNVLPSRELQSQSTSSNNCNIVPNVIPEIEQLPSTTAPTIISGTALFSSSPIFSPSLSPPQTQSQPKKLSAQNKIIIDGETVNWTKVRFFSLRYLKSMFLLLTQINSHSNY
jgi:hypothetical protein